MRRLLRIAVGLCAFACIGGVARTARAARLDPFRGGGDDARRSGGALDPFRVAQALPGPPLEEEKPKPAPKAKPSGDASTPTAKACQRDEDCGEGSICQANVCKAIELSTNLFPIYYREGAFKEIALLYWGRKGNPGYTVVFPFYWHFWSPTSETRFVAPFYWHSTDSTTGYDLKVVLNVSWSSQPGAHSFGIWPLFYASNQFGWAVPILGTFNVGDSKKGAQYGALLFLYWWKRSQAGAFDFGLAPPYVSSRNADHAFTWATPLNFYWRNADDANLLVIPLFYKNTHKTGASVYSWIGYSSHEGRQTNGAAFWLYWFGRDDAAKEKYDIFFPLLWSFRGEHAQTTVFFPLVWSFSGPKSNVTVAIPFFHYRNDTSYFNTLFPLWWSGGDEATGRGFQALIPFFFRTHDRKADSSTLLTPLFVYSKDGPAGTRSGFILPFFYWSRDRTSEFNLITPLYISYFSKTEHSMTRYALLFYQREDPQGSTTMFFPLFVHMRDAATGASATVTLLGGHRSGPRDDTTVVTLFFWRSYKPSGWSAGLFPLLFFGNNQGRQHAVVFPLFWHFGAEQETTTVMAPLFYHHRDSKGYALGSLIPLLFMGSDRGESYAIQFPLIWHFASERLGTSTTATPIGYLHTDRDGWSGAVTPLVWFRSGKTRSHFALVPLFWYFEDKSQDKSTTVATLYWHRRWGNETTDSLFPIFYYRRGARPGGDDETSLTIFPFVHYRRDADTRLWVTPLAASVHGRERSGGFVGPYIWYDDKDLSFRFIPFLHADITRHATGERTRQYGPWFAVDAPGSRARALIPFFGTYSDERETDTWVFPSYFRMRRADGDHVDALLPFYWSSTFGDRHTTVVGPYYDRTAPGTHNYGLVPLFFHHANQERSVTVIPPLLTYRRNEHDGENVSHWTALYFHKHDKDSSWTAVFPLWWSHTHGDHEMAVGFPLYWHVADASEKRSWTLAFPLFWSSNGSWRTRGLFFAWTTHDTAGEYASHVLLPLFYQASAPDHFVLFTLLGGYRRSGASRAWYTLLPPIISTDSIQTSFSMVFPLWFRHTDKALERSTTVIPPIIYISRSDPEESFTTAALLFWRHSDIASSTTVALPLYFDVHDYHLSRTTALFPFFVRHRRETDQTTYFISPFIYSHTTPTDETTFGVPLAFVPLYWDIKRGNDRTTLVLPLYAHWQRQGYRSTLIVPSYYYQEGLRDDGTPDGTYRRFVGLVLPFYDSGVKRPGDFMWNLLGGLVGRERIGHHRYTRLFWFFNIETSPAPRAQTAWYSQPVRTPRKMAARGLDVVGF